jgi:hypothetical protein
LEELVHCLAGIVIYDCEGIEKSFVQILAEVDCVWSADIFDERIQQVKGW